MKKLLSLIFLFTLTPALAADDHIEGAVFNGDGAPEAGVWVIAETDELPTTYRQIVVTDDEGRFVIPELPDVNYEVLVRGYGLADSDRIPASVGETLEIEVRTARDAAVYSSNYWLDQVELNCMMCHQIGGPETRLPTRAVYDYGLKKAGTMNDVAIQINRDILLGALEQWGKKTTIEGKTPYVSPARPEGVERNLVITQWDHGERYTCAHDVIPTDNRDSHRYPNGIIYGLDIGNDYLLKLDPNTHSVEQQKLPDYEHAKPWCDQTFKPLDGDEPVPVGAKLLGCPEPGVSTRHMGAYQNPVNAHNPMFDEQGKVWMTMQVRRQWAKDLPEFCKKDPVIVDNLNHRQLGYYYDTKTGEIVQIDTCFGTHHLQFDQDGVLWLNGDVHVVAWFDPTKFGPDDPATLEEAQGWSEGKIDTTGDGVPDTAIVGFRYSIIPNPVHGDVWLGVPTGGLFPDYGQPGYLTRYDPDTDTHEAYLPPEPPRALAASTSTPRVTSGPRLQAVAMSDASTAPGASRPGVPATSVRKAGRSGKCRVPS